MDRLRSTNGFYVVGYQPRNSILPEDYGDFPIGASFTLLDIDAMTDQGVIPPGVILQARDGFPCVVRGDYGQTQRVERLMP